MENPITMDDLGVPLFSETPTSILFKKHLQLSARVIFLGLGKEASGETSSLNHHPPSGVFFKTPPRNQISMIGMPCQKTDHQTFQVPKIEVLRIYKLYVRLM